MESHVSTGQKKTIEMIYLPERRGESCESTSPVNYRPFAQGVALPPRRDENGGHVGAQQASNLVGT